MAPSFKKILIFIFFSVFFQKEIFSYFKNKSIFISIGNYETINLDELSKANNIYGAFIDILEEEISNL